MCGIVGIVSREPAAHHALSTMTQALHHRGPDDNGLLVEGAIGFGHTRLSIVDLSRRGRQPMTYLDRYVITYNGEVYNHIELRRELEPLGYSFQTGTDTEVIMAAYDRWGVDCLSRFNGMWAFAILDRAKQRLFLSRDRFGVKPLYFYWAPGLLLFASEIKALLLHPRMRGEPDIEYCRRYLSLGPGEYLDETAFSGVQRLRNAAFVEARIDELLKHRPTVESYWTLVPNDSTEAFDPSKAKACVGEYVELLSSAVDVRLRADVKVGSALSGGLDSSSVVLLANESLRRLGAVDLQETFSCVYRSPGTEDCDESGYIDSLVSYLNVRSNQIEPREEEIREEYEKMVYFLDTPPESSLMSSWHTFRRVSATDVKVTLDGQGADEQLAGYTKYLANYLAYANHPFSENAALAHFEATRSFRWLGLTAAGLRRFGLIDLLPALLRLLRKQVFDGRTLNQTLVYDSLNRLTNLLHYADRTSMAYSIESRMPFLDYRLAEFCAALPAAYKLHDGYTKYIARLAMTDKLPADIVWRRDKMGWPIPERHWFLGGLYPWASGEIEKSSFVRELLGSARAHRLVSPRASVRGLLRLLNLATWHRAFFEEKWYRSPPQVTTPS